MIPAIIIAVAVAYGAHVWQERGDPHTFAHKEARAGYFDRAWAEDIPSGENVVYDKEASNAR